MIRTLWLARAGIAALLLAAASFTPAELCAQSLVGKDAPDFRVGDSINDSAISTLADAQGEVVLIKFWGTN